MNITKKGRETSSGFFYSIWFKTIKLSPCYVYKTTLFFIFDEANSLNILYSCLARIF